MDRSILRRRVTLVAPVAALAMLALAVPASAAHAAPAPTPGSAGIGDPYFPLDGNGGYDALNYDVRVTVDTATNTLQGRSTMQARATQSLSRFDLDLSGLKVSSVLVNGRPAIWSRSGQELVITPPRAVQRGDQFVVEVRYSGQPTTVKTPDGFDNGWFVTSDGATAVGEPPSAQTWLPVSEHPADKATFSVTATVPAGKSAISNGLLTRAPRTSGGWTTWSWRSKHPMASYLLLLTIGDYDVRTSTTASGLPLVDAVDPAIGDIADAALAREGEVIDTLEKSFGPFPFEAYGAVVDQLDTGFALETQTRSYYSQGFFSGSPDDAFVLAHETAHQWYGDSVSVKRWQDIWLNEGFATYAEWLWADHEGYFTPADALASYLEFVPADDPLWSIDISDPGPVQLFDGAVYQRGALVLQALREQVGDTAFFRILKTWAKDRRDGNGTTAQFIQLAERLSCQQLDDLFDTWLFGAGKPEVPAPLVAARSMSAAGSGSADPSHGVVRSARSSAASHGATHR